MKKLNILYETGKKIGRIKDLNSLLDEVLVLILKEFNAIEGSIMLKQNEGSIKLVASRGIDKEIKNSIEVLSGEAIAGRVFESGDPVFVDNINKHPVFKKFIKKERYLHKSFLSVPIRFNSEILGVINLSKKREGEFSEEDIEFLIFFASQIGIIVKNSELLFKYRDKALESKVLYKLSESLNSSLNFKKNINLFLKYLAKNLSLEEIGIALYKNKSYRFSFGWNLTAKGFQELLKKIFFEERDSDYYFVISNTTDGKKYLYFQPLVYNNEILGVILFTKLHKYDRFFPMYDFSFIKALANQLAVSLKKEELIKKINYDSKQLKRLNQYIKGLNQHSFEIDKIIKDTNIILNNMFKPDLIVYCLLKDDKGVYIYYNKSINDVVKEEIKRHILDIVNVKEDIEIMEYSLKTNSERCIKKINFEIISPFLSGGENLGSILIAGEKKRFFSEDEQRHFFIIAQQFSVAYSKYCLFRQNERLAYTDPITGIYNYRFFYQSLNKEFIRSKRYNYPLSLIIIDIDHFKKFNDLYGHQQGDIILKYLGKVLSNNVREGIDIVSRYGGEEFVVILPNTNDKIAIELAERLKKVVCDYRFPDFKDKRRKHHVTISLGVTSFDGIGNFESPEKMISIADRALYISKDKGRNMVTFLRKEK